jgi:uncharacterized Zn-finger protein
VSLEIEPLKTTSDVVKCMGGGFLFGHPLIYLNLGEAGRVVCPYCSQEFIKNHNHQKNKKGNHAIQR